jgi:hypothetical protein
MKTPEARLNTPELLGYHDMVVRMHGLLLYVDGAASSTFNFWLWSCVSYYFGLILFRLYSLQTVYT